MRNELDRRFPQVKCVQHNDTLKQSTMTKTPEEILGKITGITIDDDCYRIQTKTEYIIKSMEEYAKHYHTSKMGEAGSELMSDEEIEKHFPEQKGKHWIRALRNAKVESAKWMKEKASLLLAKERENINGLESRIAQEQKSYERLQDQYNEMYSIMKDEQEKKDKEIEALKRIEKDLIERGDRFKDKSQVLSKEIEELKKRIDDLNEEIGDLENNN